MDEQKIIVISSDGAIDDDLPIASTTDPEKIINSDDYVVFENVPVFVEHQRTLKNGRVLDFGKDELQAVADRSNRRIDETSDFCPVVIGHTSSDDPNVNPPKIGWAGPFRLGWLTPSKDKYAILADFRIEKEKVPLLKEYPRRSAEIWAEERYEDMYLDPISLLGADTPWSDMGVLYAKDGAGVEKVYYSIAPQAPGGYSGIPQPVKIGKSAKKEKYSMETNNGLSAEQQEVAQSIVTAILESPEFKWIRREMRSRPEEMIESDSANPLGEEETVDVVDETQEPEKKKYEMADDATADDGSDVAAEQYAKDDKPEEEVEDEEEETEEVKDEPADGVEGDIGDEDDALDDDTIDLDDKADYGDEPSLEDRGAGGDLTLMEDEPFSGGDDEDYGADDEEEDYFNEDEPADDIGDNFNLEGEDDMTQLESLKRQVADLTAKVNALSKGYDWTADKIVSAERYAKIADLRRQFVFDDKDLREKCRYNKMKNAEFESALESIRRNNRRVPTQIGLPAGLVENAPSYLAERPGAVQYSKERDEDVESEVVRLTEQYSRKGVSKTSDEIREEAKNNCGARR